MDQENYEQKLRELENEFHIMKERYQILVETTPALLFEYKPVEDKMIFTYNFPDNRSRDEIEHYHEYIKVNPLVHPDHMPRFLDVLAKASRYAMRGELEYLSKVSGGEFQWHKTIYSSIADSDGRVISVLGKINNIHKSATERQEMMHKVETDFLTGLYNKGAATEKITSWLKGNPTTTAAMLMIDLDDFKRINDTGGHSYGDEILKETVRVMKRCLDRENCLLARFGGDEFIAFIQGETLERVESLADLLLQTVAGEIRCPDRPLKCCIGISTRSSKHDSFEDLFDRADTAMYRAKRNGKGMYCVYK